MTFRIYYTVNGVEDYFDISGETIEEIRDKANDLVKARGGSNPWSKALPQSFYSDKLKKRVTIPDSGHFSDWSLPLAVAGLAMWAIHFMAVHGVFSALSALGGVR